MNLYFVTNNLKATLHLGTKAYLLTLCSSILCSALANLTLSAAVLASDPDFCLHRLMITKTGLQHSQCLTLHLRYGSLTYFLDQMLDWSARRTYLNNPSYAHSRRASLQRASGND